MQAHSPPQPMPQMHPPPPQPYLGHHHHHHQGPPQSMAGPYPLLPGATFCPPPPPPGFPLGLAGGPPRRKNATKETTALLKVWLNAHKTNPYPTKQEKVFLAVMSQMSMTQVSTWFANARRRLKKENKMTWAPRNRCDDDDDDDDDDQEEDDQISVDFDKEDKMDAQRESPQKPAQQLQQLQRQLIVPQSPQLQIHPQQQQQQANHQFFHPLHPHHQIYSLMAAHHAAMQAAAVAAAQAQAQAQQQQRQHSQQQQQQQADSCGKHPFLWRPFA